MTTIERYEYHGTPASLKRSWISQGTIMVAVSSRKGTVQTTFCMQNRPAPPAQNPAPIYRQLFQHVAGLVRLALALFITFLRTTVRMCRLLSESFFSFLSSTFDNVSYLTSSLGISLKSQIRNRLPHLWKVLDRVVVIPAQIMQAIIDFDEATNGQSKKHPMQESSIIVKAPTDDVVTISLVEHSSTITVQYEDIQERRGIPQVSASTVLDDIPMLEGRSVAGCVSSKLLECSPYSSHSSDAVDRCYSKITAPEDPQKHDMSSGNNFQNTGPATAAFEICERTAKMQDDTYHSSIDPLRPPQVFPQAVVKPTHKSDEANLGSNEDNLELYDADSVPASVEISFVSSDADPDESFSPEQIPPPYTNRDEPLAGVRILSTSSVQGQEVEQASLMRSLAADSSKAQANDPLSIPQSRSSRIAKDTTTQVTRWARKSQCNSSDSQSACNDPFHENEDRDNCASETVSCYEEQYRHTARALRQQPSRTDACNETCISCETCDRRHKRGRQSRIPRRVKTVKHFRPGSSGSIRCHSAQSMNSASTAVRRKLQERKGSGVLIPK